MNNPSTLLVVGDRNKFYLVVDFIKIIPTCPLVYL